MTRAILLLIALLLTAAAEDPEDMTRGEEWARDLIAPHRDIQHLREKYLTDPSVSAEIKHAIEAQVVVPGMCPLQAMAAAGLFVGAIVHEDPAKGPPSDDVIKAQCEHPEDRVTIEFLFRTQTQFQTPEPVFFRVRFERGRVVFVDRERRLGHPRRPDENA